MASRIRLTKPNAATGPATPKADTGHRRGDNDRFAAQRRILRIMRAPKLSLEEEQQAIEDFIRTHGITKCRVGQTAEPVKLTELDKKEWKEPTPVRRSHKGRPRKEDVKRK